MTVQSDLSSAGPHVASGVRPVPVGPNHPGTRRHPMDGAPILPRGIGAGRRGGPCRPEPGRRPHGHQHLVRAGWRRRPRTRPFRRVGARARRARRAVAATAGHWSGTTPDEGSVRNRTGRSRRPDGARPEAHLRGCSDPARAEGQVAGLVVPAWTRGEANPLMEPLGAARRPRRRARAGRGCGPPSGTRWPTPSRRGAGRPSPGRRRTRHGLGERRRHSGPGPVDTAGMWTWLRRWCTAGAARRWCTARGSKAAWPPRPSGTAGIWSAPYSTSLPCDRRRAGARLGEPDSDREGGQRPRGVRPREPGGWT